MDCITSTQNSLIKRIRSLATNKGRFEEGMFALEGQKLLEEALTAGLNIRYVLMQPDFLADNPVLVQKVQQSGTEIFLVDRAVLESASDTRSPSGVIAAVAARALQAPHDYAQGLWVALDALQDPGNLGAILRSADAMGAAGVLLGEGCVDPYSPKALRGAMGSTFHLPIVETTNLAEEIARIKTQGFTVIAAHLNGTGELSEKLGSKTMIIIGNEGNGIRDEVANEATMRYRLTMKGRAESLNAAVCASILIYELTKRM